MTECTHPPPNKTEKTTHLLFWLVFIKCRQENRNSRNVRFPWIDDKDPAMLVTYKSKRSRQEGGRSLT